jgi:hypothetical protein
MYTLQHDCALAGPVAKHFSLTYMIKCNWRLNHLLHTHLNPTNSRDLASIMVSNTPSQNCKASFNLTTEQPTEN